jgi:hypothetical protein
VDGQADIAIGGEIRLARVNAHARSNDRRVWPPVPRKCSLTFRRRVNGVSCTSERDEEGVALVIDLLPAVCRELLPKEAVMIGQDPSVLGPVRFEELGLDVVRQSRVPTEPQGLVPRRH